MYLFLFIEVGKKFQQTNIYNNNNNNNKKICAYKERLNTFFAARKYPKKKKKIISFIYSFGDGRRKTKKFPLLHLLI
jgi:hypothetical protein